MQQNSLRSSTCRSIMVNQVDHQNLTMSFTLVSESSTSSCSIPRPLLRRCDSLCSYNIVSRDTQKNMAIEQRGDEFKCVFSAPSWVGKGQFRLSLDSAIDGVVFESTLKHENLSNWSVYVDAKGDVCHRAVDKTSGFELDFQVDRRTLFAVQFLRSHIFPPVQK